MNEDCDTCNAEFKESDTIVKCNGPCVKPYHIRCANLPVKDYQFIMGSKNVK